MNAAKKLVIALAALLPLTLVSADAVEAGSRSGYIGCQTNYDTVTYSSSWANTTHYHWMEFHGGSAAYTTFRSVFWLGWPNYGDWYVSASFFNYGGAYCQLAQ